MGFWVMAGLLFGCGLVMVWSYPHSGLRRSAYLLPPFWGKTYPVLGDDCRFFEAFTCLPYPILGDVQNVTKCIQFLSCQGFLPLSGRSANFLAVPQNGIVLSILPCIAVFLEVFPP